MATSPSTIIGLDAVSYSYRRRSGRIRVLARVSLEIERASITSILGPSGCGKTTLLELMAGLRQPDSGTCLREPGLLADRGLTMTMGFQKPVLLPWYTVEQNALLPFRLAKRQVDSEVLHRLTSLLELVGLPGFRSAFPDELSGGMQMRAVFVRSFLPQPRVILMDEPFAALDETTRNRLVLEFRNLARQAGVTVVFVTHSVQEAVFLSSQVVVLSQRPARVLKTLHVPLPDERDQGLRRSPRFLELCADLEATTSYA